MISVRELRKSFAGAGVVLDDVSFDVAPGEAVAVIGPSGVGKSTLFRVLAGLTSFDAGEVRVAGAEARAMRVRPEKGSVGLVLQQHGLPATLDVASCVLAGELGEWSQLKALRVRILGPTAADVSRVEAVLERVGLAGRARDRVGELSVGQRQRVAVARTLLQSPRVVLADEPIASVDPSSADAVLELLVERAKAGATLLCALHDVERARRFFSRVIALSGGRVVYDGPIAGLTDDVVARVYRGEAS